MLSALFLVVGASHAGAIASKISKAPVYHRDAHERTPAENHDFIYDLTVPWPFHKAGYTPEPAVIDSDGDGVPDSMDRCPGTPRGTAVDANGCPEKAEVERQLLDTGVFTTRDILFDTDEAVIKSESFPILDEIGRTLSKWPELKVEIGGHTDNMGEEDYNQSLSDRRAQAVKSYLVDKFSGIRADNLTTAGYGESQPVASNDTSEGRAQNRRVEFKVLNRGEVGR